MLLDRGIPWKILAGEATQVRRVVDASAPRYRERPGRRGQSRQQVKPFRAQVGMEVSLQKQARRDGKDVKETAGYAKIVGIRTEQHSAISFADVRASGYRTTADYKRAWVMLHDAHWVRALGENVLTGDFSARFDERHGPKLVLVLTLDPVREQRGRFLAADPAAMETDYVASPARAMKGELEAVDDEYLAKCVKDNAEKPKVTRLEVWHEERAAIALRIERLDRMGFGREVRSTLRVLRRQLEILDGKIDLAA